MYVFLLHLFIYVFGSGNLWFVQGKAERYKKISEAVRALILTFHVRIYSKYEDCSTSYMYFFSTEVILFQNGLLVVHNNNIVTRRIMNSRNIHYLYHCRRNSRITLWEKIYQTPLKIEIYFYEIN